MAVQRNSPAASPNKKLATLRYLIFEVDSKNKPISTLARHLSDAENEEILTCISYCTNIFTFTDPCESPSQRDLKRVKLSELLSTIKSRKPLNKQILAPLMSMISTNLFRPLPRPLSNLCVPLDLPDDEDFGVYFFTIMVSSPSCL